MTTKKAWLAIAVRQLKKAQEMAESAAAYKQNAYDTLEEPEGRTESEIYLSNLQCASDDARQAANIIEELLASLAPKSKAGAR